MIDDLLSSIEYPVFRYILYHISSLISSKFKPRITLVTAERAVAGRIGTKLSMARRAM